jgi:hypothetical protein
MENKKPDLRDGKDKTAAVDNHTQMAGEQDKPGFPLPQSHTHIVTPEIGKGMAEGQTTKG